MTHIDLPVNVLASDQTQATSATPDKVIKLLNYCATHPDAIHLNLWNKNSTIQY
jgi:hypothetical protein